MESTSVFKGPSFYEEKDKDLFLGRKQETADLLYLVEHSDFCVCYAESGEGKSSLINAGLQPLMRENRLFPIRIIFNDADFEKTPVDYFVDSETFNKENINFDHFIWAEINKTLSVAQHSEAYKGRYKSISLQSGKLTGNHSHITEKLWWKLRVNELRTDSYETIVPVLIFDQFEEIFTRAKDISWTNAFFKWLEELYQDDAFETCFANEHFLAKRFKVLLSLRSDFVSELDYWCMNKFFLPSLKNNRYCLKPLTRLSAYEIASQLTNLPEGLEYDDIIKSAKIEKAGDWNSVENDLPCVSALVLSLVLTGLDKNDEDIKKKLNELKFQGNASDEFFFFVMNHIYEKALSKCGIGKNSSLRQIIEESLVDSNGRRRIVPRLDKDLQKIPDSTIRKLAEERIIIISGMNVEISHDCLRKVVERHNLERQKEVELEKRRNHILMQAAKRVRLRTIRQKDNLYAAIILFFSFFVSYLFLRLHSYPKVIPFFAAGRGEFLLIIKEIGVVASIAFIPTMLCGFLYHKKWGRMYIGKITSLAVFFLFMYSVFALYDSIFCPVEKYYSSNEDSAYAMLFVPCLFFSTYQRKPIWHYFAYVLLLTPFVINALGIFSLPLWGLALNLATASVFVIFSFLTTRKTRIYDFQKRLKIKLFWIISNIAILSISVYFQLGFHLTAVDYDIAQRHITLSIPWKTIIIRQNGKSGLLDARTGKEILPCVFDSIYCYHTYDPISKVSKRFAYYDFYITDSSNVEMDKLVGFSISHKHGTNSLKTSWSFSPDFERVIHSYSEMEESTLKSTSALVYKELRNEIINCSQANIQPNINNVYSLYQLDSLHKVQTYQALANISKKTESNSITDYDINKLYRAIYSDLCLCSIKDRLINQDLTGIMNLFYMYQTCEFQEEQFKYCRNTYTYSEGDSVRARFSNQNLEENNSFAYSSMLHMISRLDIVQHTAKISDKFQEDKAHLANFIDSLLKVKKNKEIEKEIEYEFLSSLVDSLKLGNDKEKRSAFFTILRNWPKDSDERPSKDTEKNAIALLKNGADRQTSYPSALFESELSCKQLVDTVLATLTPIIGNDKCINYNSSLIDICCELIQVGVCRWHEDSDKFVKELRAADNRRLDKFYRPMEELSKLMKDHKDHFDLAKQEIKEIYEGLTPKIEQILIDK